MSKPYTFEVTPGIYCVMRRSYFTCSYLVVRPTGMVAIDAGMKSTGSEMLSAIEELGKKPADVSHILLTHWHNDHAAGASVLGKLSGAEIYYSADEADHLTRRAAKTGLRGWLSAMIPETGPAVLFKGLLGNAPQQPVDATRFVQGGDVVADDFEAIRTPGHTSGHLSYFHRKSGTLFAGDALAVIGNRLRFMARPVTEDLLAARSSMETCLALPIRVICPGHRRPLTHDVEAQCERMRSHLQSSGRWPLLG